MLILRSTYNAEKLAASERIEQLELENQAWSEYADHLESKIAQLELTIRSLDPRRTIKFEAYTTPSIPHSVEGIADNNVMALSLPGMPNGSHKVVMDSEGHMTAVVDNEPIQVEDTPKPVEDKPTTVKGKNKRKTNKPDPTTTKDNTETAKFVTVHKMVVNKLNRPLKEHEYTWLKMKVEYWGDIDTTECTNRAYGSIHSGKISKA